MADHGVLQVDLLVIKQCASQGSTSNTNSMLCCVSRKSVGGSVITKKPPLIPPKENSSNSYTLSSPSNVKLQDFSSNIKSEKAEKLKTKQNDLILADADDSSVLLPCAICCRTFKPQSLEKHVKICERTATRKRKPFDSAKQRIQGTELEEFLPKDQKKKILQEEKKITSWKQNHDDFIQTIRAARGNSGESTSCRQTSTIVAPGAPTRANEKGLCPTCNRQFGIKAYDRHVAWCKERIARAPASPATNVAKERLDARMKYRAPLLKNRRMTNKEKYSSNSGIKNNFSPGSKVKGNLSLNCNKVNESLGIKQPAVTERRKGGQGKTDSVIASGPVKSRLSDRINKNVDSHNFMTSTCLTTNHIFPRGDYPYSNSNIQICPPLICHQLNSEKNDKTKESKKKNSKKLQKQTIISEADISSSKVNDVTNNDVIEMTRPSNNHRENESMITWKQINNDIIKMKTDEKLINQGFEDIKWAEKIQKLDQTYLIKESNDDGFESIIINDKYLHDEEFSFEGIKKLESMPGSPRKFNADVTCTSTPMTSKEEISESCLEEKQKEVEVIDDDYDDDDDDKSISTQVIIDESRNKSNTFSYVMKENINIHEISKKHEGMQEVDNELDKIKCSFENNTEVLDDRIVVIDEITPLSDLITKHKIIDNSPSLTLSRNFTSDSLDSIRSSQLITMRKKLRKKMHLLRESTDSLVSSLDTSDEIASKKRSQGQRIDAEEKIQGVEEINHRKVRKSLMFPEIVTEKKNDRPKSYQDREVPYWKRMARSSRSRLFYQLMRNPKPHFFPPVVPTDRRSCSQDFRPSWSTYVRRRPDFNLVLTSRTGTCHDYDPFLMADRQLNELLSDTCSDQSFLDSPSNRYKPTSPLYPLSHSSAFVKYPNSSPLNSPEKKGALIAPPSEFDDLSIGFSSDSTETNSICRELFPDLESSCRREDQNKNKTNQPILGRRIIIDKSKALGAPNIESFDDNLNRKNNTFQKSRQVVEKVTTKCLQPQINRSNSVRAASAPKIPERNSVLSSKASSRSSPGSRFHNKNNNYANLNGSNLSLSSIVSSEVEIKRSNSMFDDLVSSFEDESGSFPSIRSYLKDDSLSLSSPVQPSRTRNGQVSDEDLSSPDSYKRPDNKLSADSAYSSLNRKYSNHGNDANEIANRIDEDSIRRRENEVTSTAKSKMSKFCHECGTRFPETAKFCCECGIQRLAL